MLISWAKGQVNLNLPVANFAASSVNSLLTKPLYNWMADSAGVYPSMLYQKCDEYQ